MARRVDGRSSDVRVRLRSGEIDGHCHDHLHDCGVHNEYAHRDCTTSSSDGSCHVGELDDEYGFDVDGFNDDDCGEFGTSTNDLVEQLDFDTITDDSLKHDHFSDTALEHDHINRHSDLINDKRNNARHEGNIFNTRTIGINDMPSLSHSSGANKRWHSRWLHAVQFGISVDTFMDWNPSVLPPTCTNILAGDAYCVQVCEPGAGSNATGSASTSTTVGVSPILTLTTQNTGSIPATSSATTLSTVPASPTSTGLAPLDVYRAYAGDGTPASGWPTESQWVSFDYMWDANTPSILMSCEAWGVPNNSEDEMAVLRSQIISVGEATAIDPRFILAIIMQESSGCVRVITTAWSHANPGLMQSFNGTGSCNANPAGLGIPGVAGDGEVQTPCPQSEIRQQILDGTNGTVWGPGLVQDMAEQGNTDSSRWYRTARLYNGGSIVNADLSLPCCTPSYASDVVNRLMGWVRAARVFP